MPSDDDTLVREARDGSDEAFTALVERHGPALYRFLHRKTGSPADAEDLAQQAFVKAHRALGRFNLRKPFAPWLFTIARNLATSHYRSRRLVPEADRDYDDRTPLSELEEVEAGRLLWDWARRSLPEAQFTALWLRVEEDLDVAGIASHMQKTPSNVKVLLHRARKRLSVAYRETGDPVALLGIALET